jgi:hypothetical protein
VRHRPRLLQHRPAHHQTVGFIVIAAAALQLLLERRRRARKATALCCSQVRQDSRLETRLLSLRERHFRADFCAATSDFLMLLFFSLLRV